MSVSISLRIGKTRPKSAPAALMEVIDSVEFTHSDDGRSGFQIVFKVGRSFLSSTGNETLKDDPVLTEDLLEPFNRVIATVTINSTPRVLFDGVITYHEFSPSLEPGESIFTITGEDVSVMMDLEEKSIEHPALSEQNIVTQIISKYAKYGLVANVKTPSFVEQPLANERIPVQLCTDLEYVRELADRHGFTFYVIPGLTVGQNQAYWGPPRQKQAPLKALTVNQESFSNVESINFQYDALAAYTVAGQVQDRKTNQIQSVSSLKSRRAPLAQQPALTQQSNIRKVQFRETARQKTQSDSRTQAMVDRSQDRVVTVTGQLDTSEYQDLLEIGRLVDLRGVGYTYDGRYYVEKVTHIIHPGNSYKQQFVLTREGLGTTIQQVAV
jgi:hypothetical protein